ncbi:Rad4-domain-containing protein [Dendrothele bispora CBS 962.96]|uniref:Rad4-domain-containing protein n=1 Tax=Dendrothele bispora (strain CBS 962.96) TaxID=1314807 RepID=A0A4V4HG13_DENBC|nr:Rad4-domain-containing protein [Dendrothele bispora CBS 962.96]
MSSIDEPMLEPLVDADSDEELDWEEVEVPQEEKHLEIVLQARPKEKEASKGISHAERILRIDVHKIHTVALLMNAKVRNKWLNDEVLHARLLSLTPLSLQNSLAMIHPSRVTEQAKRGRMFETAITRLVEWWSEFFEVIPSGHIQNRTFDRVQESLLSHGFGPDFDGVIDDETLEDILDEDAEIIRSEKSLMKHALMQSGSRDVSAQLFTALCRALSIPARLVVSLQSVPWQASVGKPKPKYVKKDKGKGVAKENDVTARSEAANNSSSAVPSSSKSTMDDDASNFAGEGQRLDGMPVEKSEKAKGKEKAKPPIKLRKAKDKGNVLGSRPPAPKIRYVDPRTTAPVFWTEVFSRPDSRWIPVDPIRGIVNKPKLFDPSDTPSSVHVDNRMMYVLAFEEDGYARDVTRRYAKNFGAKVAKVQGGSLAPGAGGKGRKQWWERVVRSVTRPFRLNRDDQEDAEFEAAQWNEGMPTTMAGFKDHPLYVLVRHLKQNETIYPPPPATPEMGKFRGEPVYSRTSVVSLKTAENWLRSEGRSVKEGAQPMKLIKMRASTVGRQRELELLREGLRVAGEENDDGASGSGANNGPKSDEVMQGLYARHQTELFVPEPVKDGIVPKNNFGNIDLYVPSMLPKGAIHIPFKGVAKIARKLGVDFAEAVTGFEFRKRRATPIIEGIVVAVENETLVLDAYWEAEQDAERKARIKKEERVIKQWTRIIHGLRIRQRLQDQYVAKDVKSAQEAESSGQQNGVVHAEVHEEGEESAPVSDGGGFLLRGVDDVVQSYSLPKAQYNTDADQPPNAINPFRLKTKHDQGSRRQKENEDSDHDRMAFAMETMDVDEDGTMLDPTSLRLSSAAESTIVPKTMEELAEEAAQGPAAADSGGAEEEEIEVTPVMPTVVNGRTRRSRAANGADVTSADQNQRQTTLVANGKAKSKTHESRGKGKRRTTTPARRGKARTKARKRKRDENEDEVEDDVGDEDVGVFEGDEESVDEGKVEGDESEAGSEKQKPTPVKRTRARVKAPAPASVPTRTLRPRASKSEAQLKAEKEKEDAYRKAIAR